MTFIDAETTIYNIVKEALLEKYPDIVNDYRYLTKAPNTSAEFPFILLSQIDSHEPSNKMDSSLETKFVDVTIQVDIYSTKDAGKSECKKYLAVVDTAMRNIAFRRQSLVPNYQGTNNSITRYTATYRGMTDGSTFYSV